MNIARGIFILMISPFPFFIFAQEFNAQQETICQTLGGKLIRRLEIKNGSQATLHICECKNGKRLDESDLKKENASCALIEKPSERIKDENETTCYACFYQKVSSCQTQIDSTTCNGFIPEETNQRGDCDWIKKSENSGICISRFENYCKNEWPQSLDQKNNPGPIIIGDRSIFTDAAKKKKDVFEGFSCTNPIITIYGHGEGENVLFNRIERCLAHAQTKKITICDLGCSVVQNRNRVKAYLDDLKTALMGTDIKINITANQAIASTSCQSRMTAIITAKSTNIDFDLCSELGGDDHSCWAKEVAFCKDDKTGIEKKALCCPINPNGGYKNAWGFPIAKWVFNENGDSCPSKAITKEMMMPEKTACFGKNEKKTKESFNKCKETLLAIKENNENKIVAVFNATDTKACQDFYLHLFTGNREARCNAEKKELQEIKEQILSISL